MPAVHLEADLARGCERPIRLPRTIHRVDRSTGETLSIGTNAVAVRCGSRREAICGSCAALWRGDFYQVVHAGLAGGKGVPPTVAWHPTVFATLTAPGFGSAVHQARRDRSGHRVACRPRRDRELCPHGRPLSCGRVHNERDSCLGEALCGDCYAYDKHVLWNYHAPELWRRFRIALERSLARELGMSERDVKELFRISYVRPAEYQRRGSVHFHAVIRLDARSDGHAPPPLTVSRPALCAAVRDAASQVSLVRPDANGRPVTLRFGEQVDARPVLPNAPRRRRGEGAINSRSVASYIAKYASKAVNGDQLRAMSAHATSLRRAVLDLATIEPRAARYLHTFGYPGHVATKSRAHSITMRLLRERRSGWRRSTSPPAAEESGRVDVVLVTAWGTAVAASIEPRRSP